MSDRLPGEGHRPDAAGKQWWAAPELRRTWALIAERLEREGRQPRGRVTLSGLSPAERRTVSDLLGQAVLGDRVRVSLEALDARLRQRAGLGVCAAAEAALGRRLEDRPAARAARQARLSEPFEVYAAWRAERVGSPRAERADAPLVTQAGLSLAELDEALQVWLEQLRRDGVLGRDPDPGQLVSDALAVLERRIGPDAAGPIARNELAAQLLGDAHALDDDRRLGAVILRAVRCLPLGEAGAGDGAGARADTGESSPRSAREEWELLGLLTDRVSSTCLTLGLRARGAEPVARRVELSADQHAALHLTWRDLDLGLAFAPDQRVLVCENPRVLEAAAERPPVGVGLVCTSGRPALVTLEVLTRLRSAGARLWYHGDFDWPGLAMANDLLRSFGAQPWRMGADDYQSAPGRLPLSGRKIEADWDPALSPAMEARGVAVHEEALLPGLVTSLDELVAD